MPSFSKALIALVLLTSAAATPIPQLAGEGAAADSIFSQTDNAIGYGIEDAEENLAGNIASLKSGGGLGNLGSATGGSTGSGSAAPPPPPAGPGGRPHRRQADKIAKGFQSMSNAAGLGSATEAVSNQIIDLDGTLTGGAANLGAEIGQTELNTAEGIGKSVPKM
jgi:hypothetical protein